jgi:hypothetical protein
MYVCIFSVLVLSFVGSSLVTGQCPVQRILTTVCKIHSFILILNGNRQEGPISRRKRKKNFA